MMMNEANAVRNNNNNDNYEDDDDNNTVTTDADRKAVFAMEMEGGEASFPAPEEMRSGSTSRSSNSRRNSYGTSLRTWESKKWTIAGMAALVLVVLVTTLSVTSRRNRTRSSAAQESPQNRLDSTIAYLVQEQVSDESRFNDPSSAQYLAAKWIAQNDSANLAVPEFKIDEVDGYLYMFRYVMAVVYFSLGGEEWVTTPFFLSESDVCKWRNLRYYFLDGKFVNDVVGITCVFSPKLDSNVPISVSLGKYYCSFGFFCQVTAEIPFCCPLVSFSHTRGQCNFNIFAVVVCFFTVMGNATQHFYSLYILGRNNLQGTIPVEIGKLISLAHLSLLDNTIKGSLPEELCSLKMLQGLYLYNNELTGSLPSCLGGLPAMEQLILHSNELAGTLPTEFGKLGNLTLLSLAANGLNGALPEELCSLDFLHTLELAENNFTGTLLSCLGSLPSLQVIYLQTNEFVGTIPTEFGKLGNLTLLSIRANRLKGEMPMELCSLDSLDTLDLAQNNFTGTLPSCLGNLSLMSILFLSYNSFNGRLPTEIGRWTNMLGFYASNNKFDGNIPGSVGNWKRLQELYLDDNKFSGDPFPIIQQFPQLTQIMANNNNFSSELPESIFVTNQMLGWADLSHNSFRSQNLPLNLFNHPMLATLDLSKNKLSGNFPNSIPKSDALRFLAIYENSIQGSLHSFRNLTGLYHLDISNNDFSGPMDAMGNLTQLQLLFLSENPFERGPVPEFFKTFGSLTELSVRSTNRNGSLPELAKMLTFVDFGTNQLDGTIPVSYGGPDSKLNYLLLNNNSGIRGTVPTSFRTSITLLGLVLDGTSLANTTMDEMCQLPSGRSGLFEVLVGDCIECSCPRCECCPPGEGKGGCSSSVLSNFEWNWEAPYKRKKHPTPQVNITE